MKLACLKTEQETCLSFPLFVILKKCVLVFKRNGRRDRATFKTEKRAQNGEGRESWTHLLPRTHRMYSYIWKNFLWKKKSLKTGWVTPTQLANERRCTSNEAGVIAAGKFLECFTSKDEQEFLWIRQHCGPRKGVVWIQHGRCGLR